MSDARYPALALLEFGSVAAGIVAGDAMVKRAPLSGLWAGTVQPGHYLVLVAGDTASVVEAIDAGVSASGEALLDQVFLPVVHPDVVAAVRGATVAGSIEALGIVETTFVASTIEAADAGVKGAAVSIVELRVADGLGGKGYVLFGGAVPDVEAAVEIGSGRVPPGHLIRAAVIASLHPEMMENIEGAARFGARIGRDLRGPDAAR
jgi:microcompartment protein CcmL/EutN